MERYKYKKIKSYKRYVYAKNINSKIERLEDINKRKRKNID